MPQDAPSAGSPSVDHIGRSGADLSNSFVHNTLNSSGHDASNSSATTDLGVLNTSADASNARLPRDDPSAPSTGSNSVSVGGDDTVASTEPINSTKSTELIKKKKHSEMGVEERRLARKAAEDRSAKLSADVEKLLDEQEELFVKYAELNNVMVQRIKKLAHQLPSMKPSKKASDYNVLVYFKGKELNAGKLTTSRPRLCFLIKYF